MSTNRHVAQMILNKYRLFHDFLVWRRVCRAWWLASYNVQRWWHEWLLSRDLKLMRTVPLHEQVFRHALRRKKRRLHSQLLMAKRFAVGYANIAFEERCKALFLEGKLAEIEVSYARLLGSRKRRRV